jgi:hypothetical protein
MPTLAVVAILLFGSARSKLERSPTFQTARTILASDV